MSNQALFLSKPNGSFTLEARKSIPTPRPAQLVIRNHATALAPITVKLRDSPEFAESMRYTTWPMILGSELAGTIESVGSSITRFKPGDRVMGFSLPGTGDLDQGGFQKYTLVNEHLTSHIPQDMTFRDACTLPASIGTAAGLLMDAGYETASNAPANAKESEALLIWGGSGAVGSCTIQVAKAIGVRTVVTTASAKHAQHLKNLGADVVLNRSSPSLLEDIVRETDARGVKLTRFIDANSSDLSTTAGIVSELGGGDLLTVLPWQMANSIDPPSNVRPVQSGVHKVTAAPELGAKIMHDLAEEWLADKKVRATSIEVLPGGLDGVEAGLEKLKQGLSGVKLVVNV